MEKAMNKPTVSVIMPAYNAGAYIEEAVESVMAQTVTDWELLVLDDGSADDTCAQVEKLAEEDPRVRLLRNESNMGAANTRNRGFDLCHGRFVALLDSDDRWHPKKLETQLALLQQTGADFSYCSYAIIDAEGNPAKKDYIVPGEVSFESLLKENCIGCSTVVLRREITERYRFTPNFYHEDYVLWLQLTRDGLRGAGCTEVLSDWRYIVTSRSFDKKKAALNRWRIYRQYLKLPLWKSIAAFGGYVTASLKKYH